MIDTRLLGSGALSAIALMLAAAPPANAAAPPSADMMIAPDAGAVPISAPTSSSAPSVALQDRGRGGGNRGGGGAMRSGGGGNAGGGWGGRSRGGGATARSGDGGRASYPSASGGYERPARSNGASRGSGTYERPARSYSGYGSNYAGNSGAIPPAASTPSYSGGERGRGNAAGTRDAYNSGAGYAGGAPATNASNYGGGEAGRGERGGFRSNRGNVANERAAINRGDIQAPPTYGEGNRTSEASNYIRTDNLAAQGVTVAGSGDGNLNANSVTVRRGGGSRGDWNGNRGPGVRGDNWRGDGRGDGRRRDWSDNRRGDNWRGDGWRGDGRGDNWNRNDNWRGDRRGNWRGNDGWRGNNGWRDNRNAFRGGRQFGYNQGFRDGLRWDRGWRNNGRFNWIGHRQANRFLFAPGPYFSPFAGHFYRPVSVGFFLDPLFFQPRFFLNDPWAFRLPPPGNRFRWVRYYDDVLLVDIFTGEVVDVIENFFWQ